MKALYIHIPFCDKICTYCDFAKVISSAVSHIKYLDALEQEWQMYKRHHDLHKIQTVYFGGGTPSALDLNELKRLLSIFNEVMIRAEEITFEANPDSLTEAKIELLAQYGITRVSLGVQSFDRKQLRYLGRTHTPHDVEQVVGILKKYHIDNINLDLIYALPNQTVDGLAADLNQLLELEPMHISVYALIVEEHTKLFLDVKNQKKEEVEEAVQNKMYTYIRDKLTSAGYTQYEVSNFSKTEETRSKHNQTYWNLESYVGIGLGAHGFIENTRYANTRSITKYMELLQSRTLPVVHEDTLTEQSCMEEYVFLGLRKSSGISISEFQRRFHKELSNIYGDIIALHIEQGNLMLDGDYLSLAPEAIFISNSILSDFLLDK